MANSVLTIYYDGKCPLCLKEMQHLQVADKNNRLKLIDLHSREYARHHSDIDKEQAMNILHGKYDGKIIRGLDVTCTAWNLVEKHKWLSILRWPLIRYVADAAYLVFAKYRYPISRFLFKSQCKDDQCGY